nr:hypothetical protein [uncultured archaeon]
MLEFQGLGWEVKLRSKRNNHFITLRREIVLGNGLKMGDSLYYYLTKYQGRNAVLVMLDGKEKS